MPRMLNSRSARMLVPVALTVLVLFQVALILHNTAHDHAQERSDQENGCFLCTVAGHFVAVGSETAMPDPSRTILDPPGEQPSEICTKVVATPLNRGPPSALA